MYYINADIYLYLYMYIYKRMNMIRYKKQSKQMKHQ